LTQKIKAVFSFTVHIQYPLPQLCSQVLFRWKITDAM